MFHQISRSNSGIDRSPLSRALNLATPILASIMAASILAACGEVTAADESPMSAEERAAAFADDVSLTQVVGAGSAHADATSYRLLVTDEPVVRDVVTGTLVSSGDSVVAVEASFDGDLVEAAILGRSLDLAGAGNFVPTHASLFIVDGDDTYGDYWRTPTEVRSGTGDPDWVLSPGSRNTWRMDALSAFDVDSVVKFFERRIGGETALIGAEVDELRGVEVRRYTLALDGVQLARIFRQDGAIEGDTETYQLLAGQLAEMLGVRAEVESAELGIWLDAHGQARALDVALLSVDAAARTRFEVYDLGESMGISVPAEFRKVDPNAVVSDEI